MRVRFIAGALTALAAFAQTNIKVDVQLINVAFSVRDADGRFVTNLAKDDFEVSEDGVPQNIAFFARSSEIPLRLGLVVDFSGSQENFIKPHHKDLETFLKAVLTPRDQAFLLCFGNRLRLASDYSASAREILRSLELFEKGKERSEFPELGPAEVRPACCNTAFYDAIYYTSSQMFRGNEPGRRALIVFSDGDEHSSAHNMMDAIETAHANDVVLFGECYPEEHRGPVRLTARNKYGMSVMKRMALETGGSYFDAREHGMQAHFREIGEQLRSSYELAYHTSNPASDGSFHKIRLQVKQPGMTVRAKTGYYSR
jgi:Ca-activated chloride channel family protein